MQILCYTFRRKRKRRVSRKHKRKRLSAASTTISMRVFISRIAFKAANGIYFLLAEPMATPAPQATQAASQQTQQSIFPVDATMIQAAKLAIEQDRAIMLDYYRQTAAGTAFLGEDPDTKEKVLVKSKDEFTSLIKKMYKVGDDFIILTENSLYIVSGKIQKRKVNLAALQEAYDTL